MSNTKDTNRHSGDNRKRKGSDNSITRRKIIGAGAVGLAGAAVAGTALTSAQQPVQAQSSNANSEGESGAGELRGQVAIVTGAGRGIGRACAVALARAGADVVVLDIGRDIAGHSVPLSKSQDMAQTVRLVEAQGRRAIAIQADIRDIKAMRAAAERTVTELGKIDILFANAGIGGQGTLAETSDQQWRTVVDVNLLGTANSMRAVLPHMTERKQGRIIVTASTFGRQGTGDNVPYAATKWGLVGLVKSAALEAGKNNITVNAIAPTGVHTGLGGPVTPEQRAAGDKFFREQYHALPVGGLEPSDIAATVVFLASPGARYITGAVIDVAAGANARYTA